MTTTSTVQVEVYDFNADVWTSYTWVASRPGYTLVEASNGVQVWMTNALVRFPY